jgi:two-component system alkaline phosphatase synthesis response regulator PhoP
MSVPLRILVVEDEPDLAAGLEDDLVMEGYRVTVARDGNAALSTALDEAYDAIVLDVMLPGRDGFEVCRAIRRAGKRTPIILLTAKAQESDKVLGLELGADDYVAKPFSPRELRARLKAVMRRGQGDDTRQVVRFGDIEVDASACVVRRGGTPVDVTTMEFKLLSLFVRRKGHVLTRGQLLDAIWGSDVHVTDRVVDTHVANLRKKIEADPAHPRHIASVRGIGYRFDG